MTGFNYARARATAERLIKRFGARGSVLKKVASGTAYDPSMTIQEHGAFFAVMSYENRQIDGTRILATDKLIYLSTEGLAIDVTAADQLRDAGGAVYSVIKATPLAPAGVVVFWEVQGRQ